MRRTFVGGHHVGILQDMRFVEHDLSVAAVAEMRWSSIGSFPAPEGKLSGSVCISLFPLVHMQTTIENPSFSMLEETGSSSSSFLSWLPWTESSTRKLALGQLRTTKKRVTEVLGFGLRLTLRS